MRKQNQNAEHTTRFGSCDENRSTVFSFCDAAGSWDAPAAELDMFSRWIKLADDALAAYLSNTPTLTDDRPRIEYHNLYPLEPIRMEDLKRLREHVEPYLTISSSDDRQLDMARDVVEAIWDEHEATVDGDTTAARSALSVALKLEPENMYLRFLDRKQRASVETGDR